MDENIRKPAAKPSERVGCLSEDFLGHHLEAADHQRSAAGGDFFGIRLHR